MAVYNELQVGRYVRFIQKFFSIKGRQPAPLTFSGEIGAVLSLMHGIENRYLEGWYRYGAALSATGGAAQFAGFRFRNPANSNVIAVFEKILFGFTATDFALALLNAQTADLTTLVAQARTNWDNRQQFNPSLIVSTTVNLTALAYSEFRIQGTANLNWDVIVGEDHQIPLLPGDALTIQDGTAATGLNVTVFWRERALEDSELK